MNERAETGVFVAANAKENNNGCLYKSYKLGSCNERDTD